MTGAALNVFSMFGKRKALAVASIVIALSVCNRAQAYYYFYVTDGAANKLALVAEQIVPGAVLDYQYYVLNITPSHANVDAFSIFTGPALGAVVPQVNITPPPLFPGFGTTFPLAGGATVPFLTAEGNTLSPVAWNFDEQDNRVGAAQPTSYKIKWTATGGQPLPWFHFTRFDLFSTRPPIAGGGAVDPLGPDFLDVTISGNDFNAPFTSVLVAGTDPTDHFHNDLSDFSSDPNPFDQFNDVYSNVVAAGPLPEPGSILLGLIGMSGAWLLRRRMAGQRTQPA